MFQLIYVVMVLIGSWLLCLMEIPKMLKLKLYKDLAVFSVLLLSGTVMMILKTLEVEIPNPSDFLAWIYSPLEGLMKEFYR